MEIKCIITDDEPIARKGLRRHIGKIDFLTIVGEWTWLKMKVKEIKYNIY
jgi:hypothetical protein